MSAVSELRQAVLAGGDGVALAPLAVLELADRLDQVEARVFPPAPAPADAVVVSSEPITTERPQLSGSLEGEV